MKARDGFGNPFAPSISYEDSDLRVEQALDPTPTSPQPATALTIEGCIVGFSAALLVMPAGSNRFRRPFFGPDDLTTRDQVVGLAGLLPIPDRGS